VIHREFLFDAYFFSFVSSGWKGRFSPLAFRDSALRPEPVHLPISSFLHRDAAVKICFIGGRVLAFSFPSGPVFEVTHFSFCGVPVEKVFSFG